MYKKIIDYAAKKKLQPQGFFRKGSSRVWLDDNDYFIILVEFQPSNWEKGTYLNVGAAFLWERSESLNDTLSFDLGHRVFVDGEQFAAFENDLDSFTVKMEKYAETALEKASEYRKLRDLEHAEKVLLNEVENSEEKHLFWNVYDLAMLCFLKGESETGKEYFERFMDILKNSFYRDGVYIKWTEEFYEHCQKAIIPFLDSAEAAQRMVYDMINRRRRFFNGKAAYKNLKRDIIF